MTDNCTDFEMIYGNDDTVMDGTGGVVFVVTLTVCVFVSPSYCPPLQRPLCVSMTIYS